MKIDRWIVSFPILNPFYIVLCTIRKRGGSLAEWLACWTQVQKDPGSNRSRDAVG